MSMTSESTAPVVRHEALVDGGRLSWLEAGAGDALVLLHGIGSAAESWQAQLDTFGKRYRVIAWDAPGYGGSDALDIETPAAADYAARLVALFDYLDVQRPVIVGHSLGALMLGTALQSLPAAGAVFADPALGYGAADEKERESKRQARIDLFESLGPEGLARERSANLLSSAAPAAALEAVRRVMAGVRRDGYLPAAELLAHGDLLAAVRDLSLPCLVLCGSEDSVTPPANARRLAAAIPGARYADVPGAGHASYVERPVEFNALLDGFLDTLAARNGED